MGREEDCPESGRYPDWVLRGGRPREAHHPTGIHPRLLLRLPPLLQLLPLSQLGQLGQLLQLDRPSRLHLQDLWVLWHPPVPWSLPDLVGLVVPADLEDRLCHSSRGHR